MKKLLIVIICLLTITSCSENQEAAQHKTQQKTYSEDSYVISFELDENQTGLSEEEVYNQIYSAYSNSRIANDIVISNYPGFVNMDNNKVYYVINIYDPFVSSLFKDNGTIFPELLKEKEELWTKYSEQFIPQLEKIRTLINNNLYKEGLAINVDIRVHFDSNNKIFEKMDERVFLLSASGMLSRRERDNNVDPAMGQIIEKVKEYYDGTDLITDIYYDDDDCQLIIDIYDPDMIEQFYINDGEGNYEFNETKQEQWDEYVNDHREKSSEICQMLEDCGFEYYVDTGMTIYLENMFMINKGYWTPVIYIWGDTVVLD